VPVAVSGAHVVGSQATPDGAVDDADADSIEADCVEGAIDWASAVEADGSMSEDLKTRLLTYCEEVREWLSADQQVELRRAAHERQSANLSSRNADYHAKQGESVDDAEAVFNPGQKRVLAELAQTVMEMDVRLQAIDTFVNRLKDAPLMVQLAHVRASLRKHFDILREGAHHYLLFLLGIDAPGAHHERVEIASWMTPAALSDVEIKALVDSVLQGMADDERCAISVSNGLVLVADGANANVLYKHVDGCTYLGDVNAAAHAALREHEKAAMLAEGNYSKFVPGRLPNMRKALYQRASEAYNRALLAADVPPLLGSRHVLVRPHPVAADIAVADGPLQAAVTHARTLYAESRVLAASAPDTSRTPSTPSTGESDTHRFKRLSSCDKMADASIKYSAVLQELGLLITGTRGKTRLPGTLREWIDTLELFFKQHPEHPSHPQPSAAPQRAVPAAAGASTHAGSASKDWHPSATQERAMLQQFVLGKGVWGQAPSEQVCSEADAGHVTGELLGAWRQLVRAMGHTQDRAALEAAVLPFLVSELAQNANKVHRGVISQMHLPPSFAVELGQVTMLLTANSITGGLIWRQNDMPHKFKNVACSSASQVKASAKSPGSRGPVLVDAVAMLQHAMLAQDRFALIASQLSGLSDPQCMASCLDAILNIPFQHVLAQTQHTKGTAAVLSLIRGISAAYDAPGLTTQFRAQALRRWIAFDDEVRSTSLYQSAKEPEHVLGFATSQLKALRANCEQHLHSMTLRLARRPAVLGPVSNCERGINSYPNECQFGVVASIHGYKPDAAAIARTCRRIGRLRNIRSGPRKFVMFTSLKSSYDHQEHAAPVKNVRALAWNDGSRLRDVPAHDALHTMFETRGRSTLARLQRLRRVVVTSGRGHAKTRGDSRMLQLADTIARDQL